MAISTVETAAALDSHARRSIKQCEDGRGNGFVDHDELERKADISDELCETYENHASSEEDGWYYPDDEDSECYYMEEHDDCSDIHDGGCS